MKRYLAAAMLLLALSGCGSSGSSAQLYTTTEDFFAMDTYMSVDVSSEDVYKRQPSGRATPRATRISSRAARSSRWRTDRR